MRRDKRHTGDYGGRVNKLVLILLSALLLPTLPAWGETGYASWYGGKFQGRQTASGEVFDTNKLTAAHKTLPFGTVVEVTNLDNGKSIEVRINDRGPFVEGRVIDLSRAAAVKIGMMSTGIAPVKVEVVRSASLSPGPSHYSIQIASFSARENAQLLHSRLYERGFHAEFEQSGSGHTRVVLPQVQEAELDPLLTKLATMGFNSVLVRRHSPAN
ncbi:MAG: septal ring lytic transglycosylase RlpA family protein [Spirochaetaceae bacterium]|nr:septal ring lytic transglycosylase RlpA family protein [Spirochaetaceae bacterium]MCF7947563.1 septal ring lytic transglycosylase RlpA family protein [Spirochaetia bacterium]MCF7950487.1 septal ring lytic transglycosylase RlpA family protein [Spirochaetaceae bacterium]